MEKQRALEARRRQFVDQEMALRNRETELEAAVADAQAKSVCCAPFQEEIIFK